MEERSEVRVITLRREEMESTPFDLVPPPPPLPRVPERPALRIHAEEEPSNDVASGLDAAFQQALVREAVRPSPRLDPEDSHHEVELDPFAVQRMRMAHRTAMIVIALAVALLVIALLSR